MCPGDYAIVAGTYYFDVIKGVVEVYGNFVWRGLYS